MKINPLGHIGIGRKNFDRIILIAMVLVLMVLFIRYLGLLRERSAVITEKDLYSLIGLPPRVKEGRENTAAFREMIEKKTNLILGLRPPIFYKRLKERNPFFNLRDLVAAPLVVQPATLRIKVAEKFTFQALNGIGPYLWGCEPENIGTFEGDVFTAGTPGLGKITVTDARGHKASTNKLEVVTSEDNLPLPPPVAKINFIYHGLMKIKTPEGGDKILANIEESATGQAYYKKEGEEIAGFVVKKISPEKLILLNKDEGKEIEINRE